MLAAGVPLLEVSRWLGHRSLRVTADTYGHLVPDSWNRGRAARPWKTPCGHRSRPSRAERRTARKRWRRPPKGCPAHEEDPPKVSPGGLRADQALVPC
ncbi:hypothetical protein [Streptomyces ziwulingensis]|uniref:hypothetical protein n=1 Tax=Streptomyces ziwulingensis TaxID=1045501 RepID=UPI0031E643AE